MALEVFRIIEGLHLGRHFPDDAVRSALAFKPQPGDLFLASYPKCGTTWTQHIIYNILMDAQDPEDPLKQALQLPFLDKQGAESAVYAARPAVFKTHFPFPKVLILHTQNTSTSLGILMTCCVSFYYHTRNNPFYRFSDGTFDQFFEMFLQGRVEYGDYFNSVLSWYHRRNDSNVLFLTYEELKTNIVPAVLRIATFIDEDKGEKLKENPELLRRILEKTSFESMKQKLSTGALVPIGQLTNLPNIENLRPEVQKALRNVMERRARWKGGVIRNGRVGDWRKHFTEEQIQKMKKLIEEATGGTDLMDLWKSVDIP